MPAPSAPTSFAVAASSLSSSLKVGLKFTWTNNAPSTAQHDIEKSIDAGATYERVATADVGATSIEIGGFKKATAHKIRIRAQDGGGSSAYVVIDHTTASPASAGSPPTAPGSLTVDNVGQNTARLNWTDQSSNEAAFSAEILSGSAVVAAALVGGNVQSATLTDYFRILPNTTYRARVRALGYYRDGTVYKTVWSAYSNEVFFTTDALAMLITSPLTARAEVGQAFSYTITTNTEANAWDDADLPGWMTRTGNVLSGTPDAVGTHNITIEATDGDTTDTQTLVLTVIAARLSITSPTEKAAPLDIAFSYTITTKAVGGIANANSWSATNLPDWLSRTGATLSGTPDEPGVYRMQITATNGTQTVTATLTITVPEVTITSSPTGDAVVGVAFSHTLTAAPSSAVFAAEDLPSWLTLSGGVLSGTPPSEAADTSLDIGITATDTRGQAEQSFRIDVLPVFSIAIPATVRAGFTFRIPVRFNGPGDVSTWNLAGQSSGLNLETLDSEEPNVRMLSGSFAEAGAKSVEIVGAVGAVFYSRTVTFTIVSPPVIKTDYPYYSGYYSGTTFSLPETRALDIQFAASAEPTSWTAVGVPEGFQFDTATGRFSGSVADEGQFYISLTATNAHGTSAPVIFTFVFTPVEGAVDRAPYLPTIHVDPVVIDAQWQIRTGKVSSFYMAGGNAIPIKYRDTLRLAVIVRNGDAFVDDLTALRFAMRAKDEFAGGYLLEVAGVDLQEPEDGPPWYLLEVIVRGRDFERKFEKLNAAPGPDAASASIAVAAELQATTADGAIRSSGVFAFLVLQDLVA